ncbi:MAG: hypothetical protein IPL61_19930 [Myxococcales bacterium]|nr:hypothetical protein [Myxococcales bacterium]
MGACSDPPSACLGDCTLPLELAPTGLRGGAVVDATAGAVVDIQPPDQGGYVIYVGVRAKNVHARGASLSGALRGTTATQVLSLEERPAAFVLGSDGWAMPESGTQDQVNLPVCGPVPGPADFDAMTWQVDLTLRDSDGRTATTTTTVSPRCAGWAASDCMCSCQFDQTVPCMIEDGDGGIDAPAPLDAGVDGA